MDTNNQQIYNAQETVPDGEKHSKWKLFLFFVVGTTGVIGSALASVWIYFKTKVNKRNKYIAVATGLFLSLVGGFALQQFIFVQNPETREVQRAVQEIFGEGKVFVGVGGSKTWKNGETFTTRSLSISHFSRSLLSADDVYAAALAACQVMSESSQSYDVLEIESRSSIIYPLAVPFITVTLNGSASCEQWNDEQTLQQLRQLRSAAAK